MKNYLNWKGGEKTGASQAGESMEETGNEALPQLGPIGVEGLPRGINEDVLDKAGYKPEKEKAILGTEALNGAST